MARARYGAPAPSTARGDLVGSTRFETVRFRCPVMLVIRRLLPFFFIMSLLSLFGCSKPSTELPKLSDLRVEIVIKTEIERGNDAPDFVHESLKVVLRNQAGKEIENGDIKIEVNGTSLEFRVATGNYYDRHPYYQLPRDSTDPLKPGADYRFILIQPDGIQQEIGKVKTPERVELSQLEFPRRRPADGTVEIGWRDLPDAGTLTVFRSDTVRSGETQVLESGSANDPAALRRDIGPGLLRRRSDRWRMPDSFLKSDAARQLRTLTAEFVFTQEGRVDKTLSKQSFLRAETRLTLRMECAAAE